MNNPDATNIFSAIDLVPVARVHATGTTADEIEAMI